jgi:hypothetical protein
MIFAYIFIVLSIAIALFQVVLALGAPLGEYTLGGKYPGRLPNKLRIAAVFQILILFIFTATVVSKSGIAFEAFYTMARIGIWVVFAFFIMGTILNLSSPSKKEKIVMGPLNIIALICSFMVAIS